MTSPGTSEQSRTTTVSRLFGVLRPVVFYVTVAIIAFLLWPSSLGGCTTLIVVSGKSMEPTYYAGDIVVARCGVPDVGDVLVYQPEGYGGAKIIHRVIGGDESGWIAQGDNNDFIDPFEPTQDEVLGTARLHLPKVGAIASMITSPFVWGSLIVLALALLAWPRNDYPQHARESDEASGSPDEHESEFGVPAAETADVDGLTEFTEPAVPAASAEHAERSEPPAVQAWSP